MNIQLLFDSGAIKAFPRNCWFQRMLYWFRSLPCD
jgi:hypothetical protein